VADLEYHTNRVDSCHAGGIGLHGLMHVSLHGAELLQLESLRHALWRGVCKAKGLREWREWLLRRHHLHSGSMHSCPQSPNRAGMSRTTLAPPADGPRATSLAVVTSRQYPSWRATQMHADMRDG
jgi:hypothetical protein